MRVRLLEQGGEHILLCKSEGRRAKELAIRSRAETGFLEGLEALAARIESGKLKDPVRIESFERPPIPSKGLLLLANPGLENARTGIRFHSCEQNAPDCP